MQQQPRLPQEVQDALTEHTPDDRAALERVWSALGTLPQESHGAPDDATAWADMQARLGLQDAAPSTPMRVPTRAPRADRRAQRRTPQRGLRLVRWSPVAFAAVFALFAIWWQQPITVNAPMGAQQLVTLPDGSVVELNSASELTYQRGFASLPLVAAAERSVQLQGEAFFRVEKGERPFVVETFNGRVEVLGTQFNVRARAGAADATTTVTLAEGRVQVTDAAATQPPALLDAPGHQVVVRGEASDTVGATATVDNAERLWVWRAQGFAFVDAPLVDIAAELSRRFAVRITIEGGLEPTQRHTLFHQPGTTIEQVLHDLCLSASCRYRTISQGYALMPGAPNQ